MLLDLSRDAYFESIIATLVVPLKLTAPQRVGKSIIYEARKSMTIHTELVDVIVHQLYTDWVASIRSRIT